MVQNSTWLSEKLVLSKDEQREAEIKNHCWAGKSLRRKSEGASHTPAFLLCSLCGPLLVESSTTCRDFVVKTREEYQCSKIISEQPR